MRNPFKRKNPAGMNSEEMANEGLNSHQIEQVTYGREANERMRTRRKIFGTREEEGKNNTYWQD